MAPLLTDPAVQAAMCALRAAGASYNTIAAVINKQGAKGPLGGRWYGATVQRVLSGCRQGKAHRCTAACREQRRPCSAQAALTSNDPS